MEMADEVEFLSLETELIAEPENLLKCIRMVEVCMSLKKDGLSMQYMRRCLSIYGKTPTTTGNGMTIVDLGMKMWRSMRYTAKESLRVNIGTERARLLGDVHKVLEIVKGFNDPAIEQKVLFKLACLKEMLGQLQEAIAIFSDLIAAQAMDGVDLTLIILKASVILKHLGNHDQAIEYLEFLLDDPPVSEGYGKTHVLAFLALTYDQHPKRQDFVVVLRNTYDELLASYSQDLQKGNRPMTNQRKIEKMLGSKAISQSSEVWEMLSLQAVDRCEYLFAFELMQQAIDKAPTKYKLLHLMSEVSYLLHYQERSVYYAEKAFEINPQSTDLRTMLLLVNPSKWQDKLRNVAPSISNTKSLADSGGTMKLQRVGDDAEEEQSWYQKLAAGGPAALFGSSVSPEEQARKAKVAEHKERRKQERSKRKAKKDAARQAEATTAAKAAGRPGEPRKKRDPLVDGPARPEKPLVTMETKRLLEIAREGKGNIHWYDMTLRKYSEARVLIDRAERQWLSQQKALKLSEDKEED